MAEEKKGDGGACDQGDKMKASSKTVAVHNAEREKPLATGAKLVASGGSATAKAAKGYASSVDGKKPAENKDSALGKHSTPGQTAVPTDKSVRNNASRLSKVKASTPATHLNTEGKSYSKLGHTSLMGVKRDSKEVVRIPFISKSSSGRTNKATDFRVACS